MRNVKHFILRYSFSHQTKVGHNLKVHATRSDILYNRISDEAIGTSSYAIDVVAGGITYIIGNVIQQNAKTNNYHIVSYGSGGLIRPRNELYFVNNTVVNDRGSGVFLIIRNGVPDAVKILNNLLVGSGSFTKNPNWDIRQNLQSTKYLGFVDRKNYNYRLKSTAKGINGGVVPGRVNLISLRPIYQYKHPADRENRIVKGKLAQGAYEEP